MEPPHLTACERGLWQRVHAMKEAVTAESVVWMVRDAKATNAALAQLDTALWTVSRMLTLPDAATRKRHVFAAIVELYAMRNGKVLSNAFRAERGAPLERREAVQRARAKMRADIEALDYADPPGSGGQ